MAQTTKRVFCPECQMEVEAVLTPGADGQPLPRCTICGSEIKDAEGAAVDRSISLDEISLVDESISIPGLDVVLLVGYTPSVRQILLDKMTEKQLAREIIPCTNGEEMIKDVIQRLSSSARNGSIDLVVTDVPMPFLNGINAAIGLRAIERTYPEHDLIPILFLTNKPCDDTFKKVIRFLSPAKYATLGPVDDRDKLIKHLSRILSLVSQEKW